MFCDVAALVGVDDPPGVIHQFQVIREAEQNTALGLVPNGAFEV